jgi:hypothetical protein
MAQKTPQRQPSSSSAAPVLLFGVDEHGKPKAARFPENQAQLATKAAGPLNLQVLPVLGAAVADLAGRVPAGRIHANGRGFVPYIRRDLYAKLVAAAATSAPTHPRTDEVAAAGVSTAAVPPANEGSDRPKNWDEIATGHVVVAQETPSDGWYEAVVVEKTGDMFTLRWRDYPRERRITRHRLSLGLLYPNATSAVTGRRSAENNNGTTQKKTEKSSTAASQAVLKDDGVFPNSWEEIDVGRLVLAKEDGPWRSWWEAVPTEKSGDALTLRWRDFPQVPNIVRQRLSLALLCPHRK